MKGWFDISGAAAWCSTGKRTLEMWIKEEGLRYSRVRGKRLVGRVAGLRHGGEQEAGGDGGDEQGQELFWKVRAHGGSGSP